MHKKLAIPLFFYYLCSMFDYEKIPFWWALCPKSDCEMAETCLRHQVCMQTPQKYKRWTCVLPNNYHDGGCDSYQKMEKVTMAQGIAAIYNNVKSREARSQIRYALTAHLGSKGTYYRYKYGERLINPKLQQEIIDIVHRFAPDVEVNFDKTFEDYDFTGL